MNPLIVKNQLYLTIAHNVFLNRKQRYKIGQIDNSEIKVVGVSVPVWCNLNSMTGIAQTDEPADEVFCNYYITNKISKEAIQTLDDGYRIHIASERMRLRLLDLVDRGAESVMFSSHSEYLTHNKSYKVIHFISVNDESRLATA